MKNISIVLALIFITPLSSLADDEETTQGKQYVCTKENETVIVEKLTSREEVSSCYILINESDTQALLPSKNDDTCEIDLAEHIVKYINEGYACSIRLY